MRTSQSMQPSELIEELERLGSPASPGAKTGDCGCGGTASRSARRGVDPASLDAELEALESGALGGPAALAMDAGGDLEAELDFAATLGDAEQAATVTLEDLLALARAHPGLKISLGY